MAETATPTLSDHLGLDDQTEIPKLKPSTTKEEIAPGSDSAEPNAENNKNASVDGAELDVTEQNDNSVNLARPVNSTDNADRPVPDARSPASKGARIRGPLKTDIMAMQTIANIKVHVQAILGGIHMPVSQLAELKQGELISLDSNIGEAIDIVANGQLIARGEIVVIEEGVPRFGITLTEIT